MRIHEEQLKHMRLSQKRQFLRTRLGSLLFQGIITKDDNLRLGGMLYTEDPEMLDLAEVIILEKSKQMQI